MSRIMPAQADGRAFTSYVSSGQLEQMVQRKYNIHDELQYRLFLQRHGALVANENRKMYVTRINRAGQQPPRNGPAAASPRGR